MFLDRKRCLLGSALLLATLSVGACEKKADEGPAERAGKQIDKAVDQAGQAMDKAAGNIKDTAKAAVKATENAAGAAADSSKKMVDGTSK
jgi:hypothetical protein